VGLARAAAGGKSGPLPDLLMLQIEGPPPRRPGARLAPGLIARRLKACLGGTEAVSFLCLQLYEIPQLFPLGGLFPGAFRIIEWAAALIYKTDD
jgi:hypothetical protein